MAKKIVLTEAQLATLQGMAEHERHLARIEKETKEAREEMRGKIKALIGERVQTVYAGPYRISIVNVETPTLDLDGLREAHPRIAKAFTFIAEHLRLDIR